MLGIGDVVDADNEHHHQCYSYYGYQSRHYSSYFWSFILYVYVYIYIYIYIHTYKHIYTYIHIYIYRLDRMRNLSKA